MKTRLKIVGATLTTIFTLATVFTATLAWFATFNSVTVTGMAVKVAVATGAELGDIRLIKFNYANDSFGNLDYLEPKNGSVESYYVADSSSCWSLKTDVTFGSDGVSPSSETTAYYVKTSGETKTLYAKNGNSWDSLGSLEVLTESAPGYDTEGTYCLYSVEPNVYLYAKESLTMNIYDPVEKIVNGGDLKHLNCNTIYEASFTANETKTMMLLAKKIHVAKTTGQVSLSDYVDFDVFTESQLADASLDTTYSSSVVYRKGDFVLYNGNLYICSATLTEGGEGGVPSSNVDHWEEIENPSDDTILYHKISFLSSQYASPAPAHHHFYADEYSPDESYSVGDVVVTGENVLYLLKSDCSVAAGGEIFDSAKWTKVATSQFSLVSPYSVGDIVSYNGLFYTCKTAISHTFNASDWSASALAAYSTSSAYSVDDFVIKDDAILRCRSNIAAPVAPAENTFRSSDWETVVKAYSSTSGYMVGNRVVHGGAIYTCISDIAKPEEESPNDFDDVSSSWEEITYSETDAYSVGNFINRNGGIYRCLKDLRKNFDVDKWTLIPTYSDQSAYPGAGEARPVYVAYDKATYRCIAATTGTWNPSAWEIANGSDEINLTGNGVTVDFVEGTPSKVYINVNYAPSKADAFVKDLFKNVEAKSDFYFDFTFSGGGQ